MVLDPSPPPLIRRSRKITVDEQSADVIFTHLQIDYHGLIHSNPPTFANVRMCQDSFTVINLQMWEKSTLDEQSIDVRGLQWMNQPFIVICTHLQIDYHGLIHSNPLIFADVRTCHDSCILCHDSLTYDITDVRRICRLRRLLWMNQPSTVILPHLQMWERAMTHAHCAMTHEYVTLLESTDTTTQ